MTDIEIIPLNSQNSAILDRVADGVFDGPVQPEFLAAFLAETSHHMVLAVVDDLVVGMGSLVVYLHPDKGPNGWINEVGSGDDWRRLGIGRRIMEALLRLAEDLGCEETWLGTEPDNAPALALYRSLVSGEEAEVVAFSYDTEAN